MKVLTVFGTRPEAIKIAPLANKLAKHPDFDLLKLRASDQYRKMLDSVMILFSPSPNYDLDVISLNRQSSLRAIQ